MSNWAGMILVVVVGETPSFTSSHHSLPLHPILTTTTITRTIFSYRNRGERRGRRRYIHSKCLMASQIAISV